MKKLSIVVIVLIMICGFAVHVAFATNILSEPDYNNLTIGSIEGFTTDVFLEKTYPNAVVCDFKNVPDMTIALLAGKIDCMMNTDTVINTVIRANKDAIAAFPKAYTDEDFGIAMNKDNPELNAKISAVLDRLMKDGTVDKIIRNWVVPPTANYVVEIVPEMSDGPELIIAIASTREPHTFIMNGDFAGLEIELIRRIAYELKMKPVFHDMDFPGMLAAVSGGKCDVAIPLIITEERKKAMSFPEKYNTIHQIFAFRKDDLAKYIQTEQSPSAVTNEAVGIVKSAEQATETVGFFGGIVESFNKTFIVEDRYKLILDGFVNTLMISILASIFGATLGALICKMRMSKSKIAIGIAKFYIRFIQGIPILLILMILFYIIFAKVQISSILVAVIAFALNLAAYSAELFRTAIEATDQGQVEAALALGFTPSRSFFRITIPQALRHILPIFKGEFVSLVKMTSVVGYIAIQDLTKMSDIIRARTFDPFFPLFATAAIYFMITYIFIVLLNKLELSIDPKRRKRMVKGVRV